MAGHQDIGKLLIVAGIVIIAAGIALLLPGTANLSWLFRLPGDIYIKRKNFRFYFPVTTGILISILLSLILYLLSLFFRR